MSKNGFDWHCEKHNTFGDNGFSCAKCGYPLGVRNIEMKDGYIRILRGYINLFIVKIMWFDVIKL